MSATGYVQRITDSTWTKASNLCISSQNIKDCIFLIERGDYYRDATIEYEKLSVQRNAPRWIKTLKKYGYIAA